MRCSSRSAPEPGSATQLRAWRSSEAPRCRASSPRASAGPRGGTSGCLGRMTLKHGVSGCFGHRSGVMADTLWYQHKNRSLPHDHFTGDPLGWDHHFLSRRETRMATLRRLPLSVVDLQVRPRQNPEVGRARSERLPSRDARCPPPGPDSEPVASPRYRHDRTVTPHRPRNQCSTVSQQGMWR